MNNRTLMIVALAVLCIAALLPDSLLACPNCKAGFAETTAQASVGEAYSTTIYMMLALPALIVGFISMKIIRAVRNNPGNGGRAV